MSNEKMDVKELKELVSFVLVLVQAGVQIGKDKKVDLADLSILLQKLPELAIGGAAAFGGLKALPAEVKDMSEEELAELLGLVAEKLGIVDNAKAVVIIEKSLKVAIDVYALVKAIMDKNAPEAVV